MDQTGVYCYILVETRYPPPSLHLLKHSYFIQNYHDLPIFKKPLSQGSSVMVYN